MSEPAFPQERTIRPHEGLTKREYAAIHLMPSVILANDFDAPADVLADRAVELADAALRRAGE